MKKLILSAVLAISFASCNQSPNRQVYVQPAPQTDVVVTPTNSNVGDNLDLQSLGELVKQSNSAEEIENKLNQSGSINNLDLDGDGQVDYIKVNEVNDNGTRGFVFLVDTPNGSEQVAQISLTRSGDLANVNIQGNPVYYGSNNYYTTSHLVRDMLIYNYLFSPYHRPLYVSPYRYGYYPRTYRTYATRGYHSSPRITTRTTTTRTTRPVTTRSYNSSSYGSSSSYGRSSTYRPTTEAGTRARSASAPTSSQKSFRVTSSSASRPNTSGFGNRSSSYSSSSSSRPSSSYSSGSSRRSSYGSSSSFGSSSRSSSRPSSSYSSGSSSRSSSFGSSSRSSSRSSSFGSSSRSSSRSSRR